VVGAQHRPDIKEVGRCASTRVEKRADWAGPQPEAERIGHGDTFVQERAQQRIAGAPGIVVGPRAVDHAVHDQCPGSAVTPRAPGHADSRPLASECEDMARSNRKRAVPCEVPEGGCGHLGEPVAVNIPQRAYVPQKSPPLGEWHPLPQGGGEIAHERYDLAPVAPTAHCALGELTDCAEERSRVRGGAYQVPCRIALLCAECRLRGRDEAVPGDRVDAHLTAGSLDPGEHYVRHRQPRSHHEHALTCPECVRRRAPGVFHILRGADQRVTARQSRGWGVAQREHHFVGRIAAPVREVHVMVRRAWGTLEAGRSPMDTLQAYMGWCSELCGAQRPVEVLTIELAWQEVPHLHPRSCSLCECEKLFRRGRAGGHTPRRHVQEVGVIPRRVSDSARYPRAIDQHDLEAAALSQSQEVDGHGRATEACAHDHDGSRRCRHPGLLAPAGFKESLAKGRYQSCSGAVTIREYFREVGDEAFKAQRWRRWSTRRQGRSREPPPLSARRPPSA